MSEDEGNNLTYEEASTRLTEKIKQSETWQAAYEKKDQQRRTDLQIKNDVRLFFKAVSANDLSTVKQFAQFLDVNQVDNFGSTLLHHAVAGGSLAVVKVLVQHKADLNRYDQNGWTPLHHACSQADEKIGMYLLQAGAQGVRITADQKTPLHVIVRNRLRSAVFFQPDYIEFLTELVRLNDDANARNSQQETVLHLAVLNNSVDFVRLLMRLSPALDVNAQNINGETPLHYAIRGGKMKTVAYFLQQGADVDISGKEGNAMQIAIRENQHHILDLLNSYVIDRLKREQKSKAQEEEEEELLEEDQDTPDMEIYDRYGFEVNREHLPSYQLYSKQRIAMAEARKADWQKFLAHHDLATKAIEGAKDLRELLRRGIPKEERGDIWYQIAWAKRAWKHSPGYYQRLASKKNFACMVDVTKDIKRTFPSHVFFASQTTQNSLQKVLLAYSIRNPAVGYCQSMNFLVGMLLLNVPEERAFWLLCFLIEDILSEYFVSSMIGLTVDQKVLTSLVEDEAPKLHEHLESMSFPLSIFTTRWFMCAFLNTLPTETCMRLWDCMMLEGARMLIIFSFTLLKMSEKRLLATKNTHRLMMVLESITTTAFDADSILESTLKNLPLLTKKELTNRRHRFWMMENKHRELKREQIVFMQQDRNCMSSCCKDCTNPTTHMGNRLRQTGQKCSNQQ